jgi:ATP-dependent DNA helicase PIF1
MTVNKAQGQTIPNVGVYLPKPVFSHGQLYVALSRATARSSIRVLAMPSAEKDVKKGNKKITIQNGTYTKILSTKRC